MKRIVLIVAILAFGFVGFSQENPTKKELKDFLYRSKTSKKPLIILENKEITKDELEKINPQLIAHIMILKEKEATKKYGKKAKNGAIRILLN